MFGQESQHDSLESKYENKRTMEGRGAPVSAERMDAAAESLSMSDPFDHDPDDTVNYPPEECACRLCGELFMAEAGSCVCSRCVHKQAVEDDDD